MASVSAKWLAWVGAMIAAVVVARGAAGQVSVTLRGSAAVGAAGRDVTLGDVAEIDPPTTEEATRLGDIVVARAAAGGSADITIAQVRAALDAARVNWGRVTLRGSVCRVSGEAETKAAPARAANRTVKEAPTPQMVDVESGTIRSAIGARLVGLYAVDPADLRLAFETADEDFLGQAIGERRVDVQPAASGSSSRAPVNVYIYEGDRLVSARLVGVQALINRAVVTAREPITRGQVVGADAVEIGRQWLPPNARPPASAEVVIGQLATRNIAAGTVVAAADVAAAVACKRGDVVWVDALSGSVTVRAKARAQAQAKAGELVQLKLDGSDRVFMARMAGPGKAVMVVGSDEVTK